MAPPLDSIFDIDPDRLDRGQLPLYGRLIDAFARQELGSGEGKWLTGAVLRFVRDNEVYKDYDLKTFGEWVRSRFPFNADQAERYIQVAELPRELVKDVQADLHRLAAVRSKPAVFWPPLIQAAAEGVAETMLTRAARAGKAYLVAYPEGDKEDLCAYVLDVARGGQVRSTPRQPSTPGKLGNQVLRALRGKVRDKIGEIAEIRAGGTRLYGAWMGRLWEEMGLVVHEVAEVLERDPQELLGLGQAGPREAGEVKIPSRENQGEHKDNEGLSSKKKFHGSAPPAAPAAQAAAPKEAAAPARKGISFQPLIDALLRLTDTDRDHLGTSLHRVVAGHPLAEVRPRLLGLCEQLVEAGVPRELADRWLSLLSDPDRDKAAAFALWFYRHSRLPTYYASLRVLSTEDLPAGRREQIEELLAGKVPSRPCTQQGAPGGQPGAPS